MRVRGALPALDEFAARHHLGHDQPGAVPIGAQAERLVGDARHRRQENAVADFDAADVQAALRAYAKSDMHKNQATFQSAYSLAISRRRRNRQVDGNCGHFGLGLAFAMTRRIDLGHGQGRRSSRAIAAKVAVVIVAAGRGERAGQARRPQAIPPHRRPADHRANARRLPGASARSGRSWWPSIPMTAICSRPRSARDSSKVIVVHGGATRQDSVRLGLAALRGHDPQKVLIHDAARPFVDAALIDRVDCRDRRAPGRPARGAGRRNAEARRRRRDRRRRPCRATASISRRRRRAFPSGRSMPRMKRPIVLERLASPTTRRSPNGPKCRCRSWPARRTT